MSTRIARRNRQNPNDLAIREHLTTVEAEYGNPPQAWQPQYRRSA